MPTSSGLTTFAAVMRTTKRNGCGGVLIIGGVAVALSLPGRRFQGVRNAGSAWSPQALMPRRGASMCD
ncbi:MAG: hypothetical protein E6J72_05720 [Deltaproteobacteria bacterium]|nr:MAG: hypothetical protein E6J72_05720 [Deltaproteobacteria bacterium]